MTYALWIVQALLAAFFLVAGVMRITLPIDTLAAQAWVRDVPTELVRFIGVAETLGAIGLLVPALTRIQPWLTPLAAVGLALVMLLATGFHLTRGEGFYAVVTFVLLVVSAFVAYGRWQVAPHGRRELRPAI